MKHCLKRHPWDAALLSLDATYSTSAARSSHRLSVQKRHGQHHPKIALLPDQQRCQLDRNGMQPFRARLRSELRSGRRILWTSPGFSAFDVWFFISQYCSSCSATNRRRRSRLSGILDFNFFNARRISISSSSKPVDCNMLNCVCIGSTSWSEWNEIADEWIAAPEDPAAGSPRVPF